MIEALCYALLAAAWLVDMLTPQLFVVAIVLNGPIALSSLALRPGLTMRLVVLAEIANVVAGYWNGAHAGYHWDAIGLGDRVLTGASFVLVGVLTIRAQSDARRAGESDERARQIAQEQTLRRAMARIGSTLNVEMIVRSTVREALVLSGADRATLVVRRNALDVPVSFEANAGNVEIAMRRERPRAEIVSLLERARESKHIAYVEESDPLGRLLESTALVASIDAGELDAGLILSWKTGSVPEQDRALIEDFVASVGVALRQAQLFVRLTEKNDEVERQKDELQARSEVIRDIVYALAHDLRTPLIAADATMMHALEGTYGEMPERYKPVLEKTIVSNGDLRRLVETLLVVARFESGEDSRLREPVAVAQTIARVVDDLQSVATGKGIALTSDAPAEVATVEANADEIRRAVTNLVGNALEATPWGGHVAIAARSDSDKVIIEVSDDGFGVPPDRRPSLFQRFGGVRGGGGTGLGLYIVARIAEKYGGRATFAPIEPHGSRFTLELPVRSRAVAS